MHYHIRHADREIKDPQTINDILKRCRYASIALSKNDTPSIVTLTYGYDPSESILYFHCAKEGMKMDFIRSNPKACITVIEDFGNEPICDHSYRSLVIHGTITPVQTREETDHAIRLLIKQLESERQDYFVAKLQPGNKGYDNLQVLRCDIEQISGKARE
jgi:uncharacterized protein